MISRTGTIDVTLGVDIGGTNLETYASATGICKTVIELQAERRSDVLAEEAFEITGVKLLPSGLKQGDPAVLGASALMWNELRR